MAHVEKIESGAAMNRTAGSTQTVASYHISLEASRGEVSSPAFDRLRDDLKAGELRSDVALITNPDGFIEYVGNDDLLATLRLYEQKGPRRRENESLIVDLLESQVKKSATKLVADVAAKATVNLLQDVPLPWLPPGSGQGLRSVGLDLSLGPPLPSVGLTLGSPLLILLPDTFTDVRETFVDLLETDEWRDIEKSYKGSIYALPYNGLAHDPIHNATLLLDSVPTGTELHLFSRGAGGLIGEVLSASPPPDKEQLDDEALVKLTAGKLGREGQGSTKVALRARALLDRLGHLVAARDERKIKVTRFVRVSCPVRGTPLADPRQLKSWLSMTANVIKMGCKLFGYPSPPGLSVLTEIATRVLDRSLGEEQGLPGLASLSATHPLPRLLAAFPPVDQQLTVVAGVFEGIESLTLMAAWIASRYFQGDNDLQVPTASMLGGLPRSKSTPPVVLKGLAGAHFNTFTSPQARAALRRGLLGSAGRRSSSTRSSPATGQKAVVFLLPGIMGTSLTTGTPAQTVWVNYLRLLNQGFGQLALGPKNAAVAGELLASHYGALQEFLSQQFDVVPFPYDWRQGIETQAHRLAQAVGEWLDKKRVVHFLAHSMGGLVVRAAMADADHGAKVRAALDRNGRFVMLGTPNNGSVAAVRALLGEDPLIKLLAAADLTQSRQQILQVIRTFQGLIDMVDERFLESKAWAPMGPMGTTFAQGLASAKALRKKLTALVLPAGSSFYVAGAARDTPSGLTWDQTKSEWKSDYAVVGDGTVLEQSSVLHGVPTYFVNALHGDLSRAEEAFADYAELLSTGKPRYLSSVRPTASWNLKAWLLRDDTDGFVVNEDDLLAAAMGSALAYASSSAPPPVVVSVHHGSLGQARYPVLLGHYAGNALSDDERYLDRHLDGALTNDWTTGNYPGEEIRPVLYGPAITTHKQASPNAALVVGLGTPGDLDSNALTLRVKLAVLTLLRGASADTSGEPVGLTVTLLVDPAVEQLSISEQVRATLQGVDRANRALPMVGRQGVTPFVHRVEFFDRYTDRVKAIARAAKEFATRDTGRQDRTCSVQVEPWIHLEGGFLGDAPGLGSPSAALPLNISIEAKLPQPSSRLRLHYEYDTAGTLSLQNRLDLPTGSQLHQLLLGHERGLTTGLVSHLQQVFRGLLPADLQRRVVSGRDVQLRLDSLSASIPWELLALPDDVAPLVTQSSFVRRLINPPRLQPVAAAPLAVVIGDPAPTIASSSPQQASLPRLPGARRESETISRLLRLQGFQIEEAIAQAPHTTWSTLVSHEPRVLHIACHGHVSSPEREVELLLGDGFVVNATFPETRRRAPAFVFLNCCHAGSQTGSDWMEKSVSLAEAFLQRGSRALVIAAWAIDDQLAMKFAETLYANMVGGVPFGESLRRARKTIYDESPNDSTWAAFQAYGDPYFVLHSSPLQLPLKEMVQWVSRPQDLDTAISTLIGEIRTQTRLAERQLHLPNADDYMTPA